MSKYTYTKREKRYARRFGVWLALFTRFFLVQFGGCLHRFQHTTSLQTRSSVFFFVYTHKIALGVLNTQDTTCFVFFFLWTIDTCAVTGYLDGVIHNKTASKVFECFCVFEHRVNCRCIRKRAFCFFSDKCEQFVIFV